MVDATEQFLALEEILRWYAQAGVDSALDETPHDRFAEALLLEKPVQSMVSNLPRTTDFTLRQPLPNRQTSLATIMGNSPDEAQIKATEYAANASNLSDLRSIMNAFDGCALKATATQMVFGAGNENAKIMFVGEAPGREEDIQGIPFVGAAGQLLNKMLAAILLNRDDVYIANVVPWRPPGNRTPTTKESFVCRPFIIRQIELINPDILVCMGGVAAQVLLNQKLGILKIRGHIMDYMCLNRQIKAVPTLHPAYLLRQPLQKRLAWKDLQMIKDMTKPKLKTPD